MQLMPLVEMNIKGTVKDRKERVTINYKKEQY